MAVWENIAILLYKLKPNKRKEMKDQLNQIRLLVSEIVKTLDSIEGKESNVSMLKSISTNNSIKKDTKLLPKDRVFLEKLVRLQKANNSNTTFLESLLENEYDTVTSGQYAIIVKIANDHNVSADE